MRSFGWILLGVLAQLVVGAGPAAADFPGHNGRILFTTPNRPDLPPSCGVASVSAAGTGYECVDPVGFDPSATPNHRLIAEVRPGNPAQVYTVTLTGTGARRLTNTSDADNLAPTFSPDSRRILYFQSGGSADGVYVMNADGSGQRRLISDLASGPVFSPNGAQIAYSGHGISIAAADGSGSRLIIPNSRSVFPPPSLAVVTQINSFPNWAPDGRHIAFSRQTTTTTPGRRSVQEDVYVANADGTGIRPLTATGGVQEEMPSWSPDARQIAYFRARPGDPDGVGEIWVMNADGTSPRRVALGWHPHWSTVQGSPGQPRLVLHIQKLDRHRSCLGQYDGLVASVKTRSSKQTRFDFALYVDGRQVDHVFATRSLGLGVDLLQLRRGPHRMRAVMTDPAVHDTAIRTATFRKC